MMCFIKAIATVTTAITTIAPAASTVPTAHHKNNGIAMTIGTIVLVAMTFVMIAGSADQICLVSNGVAETLAKRNIGQEGPKTNEIARKHPNTFINDQLKNVRNVNNAQNNSAQPLPQLPIYAAASTAAQRSRRTARRSHCIA